MNRLTEVIDSSSNIDDCSFDFRITEANGTRRISRRGDLLVLDELDEIREGLDSLLPRRSGQQLGGRTDLLSFVVQRDLRM